MAIRIERGGSGSDTAGQILAQAGQGEANRQQQTLQALLQLAGAARPGPVGGGGGGGGGGAGYDERALAIQKLNSARAMKTEEIQAQAKRDQQAADQATAKTAVKFGLDEQVREQEFENTVREKQEAARLEAENFDYEYSQKSKQRIARINQARQTLRTSEDFTPDEKADGERELTRQLMGITQDAMPADRNRWKGDPRKAPGNGETWQDEDGNTMTTGPDGVPKLILQYKQSRAYQELELKAERAQKVEDKQAELQSSRRDSYMELLTGEVTETIGGIEEKRKRTSGEAQEIMAKLDAFDAVGHGEAPQTLQAPQMTAENADVIYESLNPGDEYIGPDGQRRRKPGLLPQQPIPMNIPQF